MKLSEFDYSLPKGLIAQHPTKERDRCRLMALDRSAGAITHCTFSDVAGYLKRGDLLVLNNTRVIPARLFGKRKTGGKVEIFLLEKKDPVSEALIRPSGRIAEGEKITLESGDEAEILGRAEVGRHVRFGRPLDGILKDAGHMPLPPYIGRDDEAIDAEDYQTVFSRVEGATASPTAGLHFTQDLLDKLAGNGVSVSYVTLHTNYGTFAPVKEDEIEKHKMHHEYFDISKDTAEAVIDTKKRGGRVVAVGTTSARVLEHWGAELARRTGEATTKGASCCSGYTNLFIYPGFEFKVVDALITNFHLPKSTLLLLVSAFAGKDFILRAYGEAVKENYRFFSYGDAMIIM